MITAAVRHTVNDFDTWKPVFDEHGSVRAQHGATGTRVLHDGNNVLVLIDFPDEAAMQAFMSDPSLADAMTRGGVTGPPDIAVMVDAS
jgi:hypothetical protein